VSEPYRVADFIADFVADLGVRHVFLLPGGGAMHLVDAIAKCPRLQAVACQHEQAAAIAAEAYSRIDNHLGVAVVTSGPGATNAVTAVAGAWIESVPLVVVSGQVKRADLMRDARLRQGGVQEVDIVGMVKGITKYAVTVMRPEDIRIEMERATHLARSGRAGPVWIDVPLDVQGAPLDPTALASWRGESDSMGGAAEDLPIAAVLDLLRQAERPLILAGHGVRLAGAAEAFRQLAEALDVPVVTTWNALDLLPYDHPLLVGRPGVVALRAPNFAVQNCDLLISIGSRLDNVITAYNPRGFARNARKVVIDVDRNEIHKLDMDVTLGITADAGDFIRSCLAAATGAPLPRRAAWKRKCADWKRRFAVNDGKAFPRDGAISHYHFVDALSDAIPEDTIVATGSSGLAVEAFYSAFRNKPGQRVFLTSGLGAMGYGLPAAIGACFSGGCRRMVAVESDGSLQLNVQELATLNGAALPVCLLIMNNGGYASIRNTQRNYFKGRFVGTGPEAGLVLPDLERIAAAYGLAFLRIEDASELVTGLGYALSQHGPLLVDVRLVSDESLAPKVSALPQPDGSMLSMPLEDMTPLLSLAQLQHEMSVPLAPASVKAREALPS
jgi:acetolactate synthase-1/2/3 large subunit